MSFSWQDAIVLLAIAWAAWRIGRTARGFWAGEKSGCPSCGACGGKATGAAGGIAPQVVELAPLASKRNVSA